MKKLTALLAMIASGMILTGFAAAAESEANNLLDVIAAPSDIIETEDGFLVTDTYNRIIWEIKDGKAEAYAGGFTTEDLYGQPMGGYVDTKNENSYFRKPWAISPFLNGYAVTDPVNHAVRYVDTTITQTVNGKEKITGMAEEVKWSNPMGLATDESGNLYVADAGEGKIRMIAPEGAVTDAATDLNEPTGLCWKNGALYIAETGEHRIMKLEGGELTCVAGTGIGGMTDGDISEAEITCPQGVEVSDDGRIFIADTGNNAVRMVADGQMTTLISVEKGSLQLYPVEPLGMLCKDGLLYVCDAFGRTVYTLEY